MLYGTCIPGYKLHATQSRASFFLLNCSETNQMEIIILLIQNIIFGIEILSYRKWMCSFPILSFKRCKCLAKRRTVDQEKALG